jgi:hypothetical protein
MKSTVETVSAIYGAKRLTSGSAESSSSREGDEARTSFLFLRGEQLNTLITFPHLQRVVRATFFPGGSYVKHADNLPSSAEGGQGDVLPGGKIRQTAVSPPAGG